jgi:hypothetical protein
MTNASSCLCVVDCAGLYEIATTTSNNLKSLYLDRLSSGEIGVPSCVWNEFRELYEEEAAEIEGFVARKISMKRSYHTGAARIADKLNSGFSRGSYDSRTDLYTASIASIEGLVVLTSASQQSYYDDMDCEVSELGTWAEDQD